MRTPQILNISFKSQAAGEPFQIRNADLADDLFEAMSLLQSEKSPIISLQGVLEKGWDETREFIHTILDNLGRIPEVLHVGVPVLMKVLELLQTLRNSEIYPREDATIWTQEDESLEEMLGVGNLELLWERAPQVHLGDGTISVTGGSKNFFGSREGPPIKGMRDAQPFSAFRGGLLLEAREPVKLPNFQVFSPDLEAKPEDTEEL